MSSFDKWDETQNDYLRDLEANPTVAEAAKKNARPEIVLIEGPFGHKWVHGGDQR